MTGPSVVGGGVLKSISLAILVTAAAAMTNMMIKMPIGTTQQTQTSVQTIQVVLDFCCWMITGAGAACGGGGGA